MSLASSVTPVLSRMRRKTALLIFVYFFTQYDAVTSYGFDTKTISTTETKNTTAMVNIAFTSSTQHFNWPLTVSTPSFADRRYSMAEPETVIDYLNTCKTLRDNLRYDICLTPDFSCRNRCGRLFYHGQLWACMCDVYCKVFNDCCWDFQKYCSRVSEKLYRDEKHLIGAGITCDEKNRAVIKSCRGNHKVTNELSGSDPRTSIISINNGLLFQSQDVYHQCYSSDQRSLHTEKYYWDVFVILMKGISVEALQHFFEGNKNIDGVHTLMLNPQQHYYRYCEPIVKVFCQNTTNSDGCKMDRPFNVASGRLLCKIVQNDEDGSEESPFYKDKDIDEPDCRVAMRDAIFMKKAFTYQNDIHVVMIVNFRSGLNQPVFKEVKGPYYEELNPNLKTYACQSNSGDVNKPCRVVAVCKNGFTPIDLICRKPSFLYVSVVGLNNKLMVLERILFNISQFSGLVEKTTVFGDDEFQTRMDVTYSSDSKYKAVTNFWEIQTVDGVVNHDSNVSQTKSKLYITDSKLSITDIIVQKLQNSDAIKRDRSFVRKLTICVVTQGQKYHPHEMHCDEVLEHAGGLRYHKHSRTQTLYLSDLFSFGTDSAVKMQLATYGVVLSLGSLLVYAIMIVTPLNWI